jgi:hypothetical protein
MRAKSRLHIGENQKKMEKKESKYPTKHSETRNNNSTTSDDDA